MDSIRNLAQGLNWAIQLLEKSALKQSLLPDLSSVVAQLDIKSIVETLMSQDFPSIGWNQGKILAVNGKTMMTGDGNYWKEYTSSNDIIDHQAKVVGDAAISTRNWADYFWG